VVGRPGEAGQEGGKQFGDGCQTTTTKTKKAFIVRHSCCMTSEGWLDTSWGVRLRLGGPGKCCRSVVGGVVVERETTMTKVMGLPSCVVDAVSPRIGFLEPFAGARSGLGGQWKAYQQGSRSHPFDSAAISPF
jgi:hypothetical protein